MKRPKKQARPTAEIILDGAMALFYGRGLRAVSLDDVAARAGVTKRTLYYHFATKDELVLAYLNRWRERARSELAIDGDAPPLERLLGAFKRLEQDVAQAGFRGCPFVNAVAEINDRSHPATALAAAYKEDRRGWFERLLREAGVAEAERLAGQIMALWEGAIVRALVTGEAKVVREAGDAAKTLLAGAARRSTLPPKRGTRT